MITLTLPWYVLLGLALLVGYAVVRLAVAASDRVRRRDARGPSSGTSVARLDGRDAPFRPGAVNDLARRGLVADRVARAVVRSDGAP